MKCVIRVDASLQIGSGHIMRCISLAQELRASNAEVLFVSREHPGNMCDHIVAQGFQVERLPRVPRRAHSLESPSRDPEHAEWLGSSAEEDAALTIQAAAGWGPVQWLIVDHYALNATWEAQMRSVVERILVIDDLADRPHECDVLLDQNYIPSRASRYDALVPSNCRKLLGPRFAMLRREFQSVRTGSPGRRPDRPRRILMFFGGVDPSNETGKAINAFLALSELDLAVDVVVGPGNPHLASIEELSSRDLRITLHRSTSIFAELLAQADLALGAGGTTTWERLYLGVPSIVVAIARNQVEACEALAHDGYITYLGRAGDVSAEGWSAAILTSLAGGATAESRSLKGPTLVDGLGAQRVAATLTSTERHCAALTLRPPLIGDSQLYFDWVNDPDVRLQALSERPILRDEHEAWFRARIASRHTLMRVAEMPGSEPIGQVRLDEIQTGWLLAYSVDRRFRGRGFAAEMLGRAIEEFRRWQPDGIVVADVKVANIASRQVLSKLGFVEVSAPISGTVRLVLT